MDLVFPSILLNILKRLPLWLVFSVEVVIYWIIGYFLLFGLGRIAPLDEAAVYVDFAWKLWWLSGAIVFTALYFIHHSLRYAYISESSNRELRTKHVLLFLGVITLAWFVPPNISTVLPEYVRILWGIAAFMVPGMLIQWYLQPDSRISRIIVVGFGISAGLTIIGLLLTSTLRTSIQMTLWGLGLITYGVIIYGLLKSPSRLQLKLDPPFSRRILMVGASTAFVVIVSWQITVANNIDARDLGDDQGSYMMEVTEIRAADSIMQTESLYNSERLISTRFMLSYWTGIQGILGELSDLHVYILSEFLSSLVVMMVFLSIYELARTFSFSVELSLFAIIAHGTLLYFDFYGLQWDNTNILIDKVILPYLFLPMILIVLSIWLRSKNWRSLIPYICIALLIGYTHPTSLAFASIFIGVYLLAYLFYQLLSKSKKISWAVVLIPLFTLVILNIQYLPLRLIDDRNPDPTDYSSFLVDATPEELLTFYHLVSYGELTLFGIVPWYILEKPTFFIMLLALIMLLIRYPHKPHLIWLLAAQIGLYLILVFPYTATILAKFVTFTHLNRALLINFVGILAAFLLKNAITYYRYFFSTKLSRYLLIGVFSLALMPTLLGSISKPLIAKHFNQMQTRYIERLMMLNNILSSTDDDTVVIAASRPIIMTAMPSLNASFVPLKFRGELTSVRQGNLTSDEASSRHKAWDIIMDTETTPAQFQQIINEYEIDFIVADSNSPYDDFLSIERQEILSSYTKVSGWHIYSTVRQN